MGPGRDHFEGTNRKTISKAKDLEEERANAKGRKNRNIFF
jgi:hypothetical protein